MKQAGYTLTEMNRAGYTLAEMNRAGYVEGLKLAGYTIAEAKQALGTPTAAPPARARTPPYAGMKLLFWICLSLAKSICGERGCGLAIRQLHN